MKKNSSSSVIVVSRSHAGQVETLVKTAFGKDRLTVEPAGGSGYKTLRVLNGTAAAYIHKTGIKKWDVCAGDAIMRAAGGRMSTLQGSDLNYLPDSPVSNSNGLLVALNNPFAFLAKLRPHIGA